MELTQNQLDLLWHMLGVTPERREPYRNHYVCSDLHYAYKDLTDLESVGMVQKGQKPSFIHADDIVFIATEQGKQAAIQALPKPKKKSKYQEFLDADYGHSFAEFLGIDVPQLEYSREGFRYVRTKRTYWHLEVIYGDWSKTRKEAKASYKAALAATKTQLKSA